MNAEVIPWTEGLISALLTGLYQGALMAGVVWLCLRLWDGANAATRYATWYVTLLAVVGLPLAHFVLADRTLSASEAPTAIRAVTSAPDPQLESGPKLILWPNVGDQWRMRWEPDERSGSAIIPAGADDLVRALPSLEAKVPAALVSGGTQESEAAISAPSDLLTRAGNLWQQFGSVSLPVSRTTGFTLLCAVAALAGGRLLALMLQLLALARLRRDSTQPPQWLLDQFRTIASQAGLRRTAGLRISDQAHSPMVVGVHPPTVLIPEHLLSTPDPARLNPVLRHEIAHLQRFDDWLNLVQQTLRAFFGFHPAVLWISHRISVEREIACDDHVLHAGQKPREYALLLTEFAVRNRSRIWSAAPAAWSRKSQLTERVTMILKTNRSISPRVGRIRLGIVSATLAGCALLTIAAAPRVGLDEEPIVPTAGPVVAVASGATAPQPAHATAPTSMQVGVIEHRIAESGERSKDEWSVQQRRAVQPGRPAGSIEERLDRLERMVERLMNEPRSGAGFAYRRQPGVVPQFQPAPAAPLAPAAPRGMPAPVLKEPGAAMNLYGGGMGGGVVLHSKPEGVNSELHLRTLEARRKVLEQQIAALEGQLHHLERQQDDLEKEREKLEQEREKQMRERNRARQERQYELKKLEQDKNASRNAPEKEDDQPEPSDGGEKQAKREPQK